MIGDAIKNDVIPNINRLAALFLRVAIILGW